MNSFEKRLERVEVEEPITVPNADGTTRTVMVKVPALRDPEDGEIYFGTDASVILDKAKARHMGVLAPQELAELRQRLGLTQKEIAAVLQIGEKTWSRWETGREIVSRSLNVLLRAVYEGKISLPWLRALLSRDEPMKLIPHMRICGGKWGFRAAHVWISSPPSPVQLRKAEALINDWSQLWVHGQTEGALRSENDVCVVRRRQQLDFVRFAGKTEEMPLGA